MEQELTPSESLKLIETMIGQAKSSFSRMSFYFLMWGVLLLAAMVTTYMMRDAGDAWAHGAAWGVAGALGGIISSIYGFRQGKKEQVANPMDRVVGWIWGAFVITMLLMMFAFAGTGRDPGAAITLLTAMPTFLTGRGHGTVVAELEVVRGTVHVRYGHVLQRERHRDRFRILHRHGIRLHRAWHSAQASRGWPSHRLTPSCTTNCGWRS